MKYEHTAPTYSSANTASVSVLSSVGVYYHFLDADNCYTTAQTAAEISSTAAPSAIATPEELANFSVENSETSVALVDAIPQVTVVD